MMRRKRGRAGRLSKREKLKLFTKYWNEETEKHLNRYGVILKKDALAITKKCLKKAGFKV